MKKKTFNLIFTTLALLTFFLIVGLYVNLRGKGAFVSNSQEKSFAPQNIINTPSPTPTTKPLSFAEMQKLFGPCTITPIIFYHHIQSEESAKTKNQASLSVYSDYFEKQVEYLKNKSYTPISMGQLNDFFTKGESLPPKSIILTFDDGYEDFYLNAYPVLKQYGFKATVFLPTGLVNNPNYLSWQQIGEMNASGLVYFGNHTWSHHSTISDKDVVEKEISTADMQLSEKGLNATRVFAYPYGSDSSIAENYLKSIGYNLAFTVHYGKILCYQKRFSLPRIRVGNIPLTNYGL